MLRNVGIVYIVPHVESDNAISLNIQRRKKILEDLGYTVTIFTHHRTQFINTCIDLWHARKQYKLVFIRIDGTCILDKYSLLKFLLRKHNFIWEIHGVPEEKLEIRHDASTTWFVWKNKLKRLVLSFFIQGNIFISKELYEYAKHNMFIQKYQIIPNFLTKEKKYIKSSKTFNPFKPSIFKVLWGGDASLPWNATDIIGIVAQKIQEVDNNILFIIVGSNFCYPKVSSSNIFYLQTTTHKQFTQLIQSSDLCLALYHQPKYIPFYFSPMKILDYLSIGKPIIATNTNSIRRFINHEVNGLLTNNSISDIVHKILKVKRDQQFTHKLSQNAIKSATTKFTERSSQNLYEDFLRNL